MKFRLPNLSGVPSCSCLRLRKEEPLSALFSSPFSALLVCNVRREWGNGLRRRNVPLYTLFKDDFDPLLFLE